MAAGLRTPALRGDKGHWLPEPMQTRKYIVPPGCVMRTDLVPCGSARIGPVQSCQVPGGVRSRSSAGGFFGCGHQALALVLVEFVAESSDADVQ